MQQADCLPCSLAPDRHVLMHDCSSLCCLAAAQTRCLRSTARKAAVAVYHCQAEQIWSTRKKYSLPALEAYKHTCLQLGMGPRQRLRIQVLQVMHEAQLWPLDILGIRGTFDDHLKVVHLTWRLPREALQDVQNIGQGFCCACSKCVALHARAARRGKRCSAVRIMQLGEAQSMGMAFSRVQ